MVTNLRYNYVHGKLTSRQIFWIDLDWPVWTEAQSHTSVIKKALSKEFIQVRH